MRYAVPVTALNAEGNKALHAPRLAGMDSEYMKRQLRHFKRGVRGHS